MSNSSKLTRLARGLAYAYLASLVLILVSFRIVGERWWIVTLAMYLPRVGFFLPMPFVVGACLATKQWAQAAAVAVVGTLLLVFPIMGYQPGGSDEHADNAIRVMSWNTYLGRTDNEGMYRKVSVELKPDIFVAQATAHRTKELFRADPAGYNIDDDDEFFIATRYPILDKYVSQPWPDEPRKKPNFVRWTLQTPVGPVDVFDVHPRSPRNGMDALRGRGLLTRLKSGDVPTDDEPVSANTALRRRQVEDTWTAVQNAKHPVIVAGDTNLPTQSWLYEKTFAHLRDGFSEVGHGLGYTFPAKHPWLRIDRIMTDDHFRFLHFEVGDKVQSDHMYVLAELVPAGGGK